MIRMNDTDGTDGSYEPYKPNDIEARFDRIEEVGMSQTIIETDPTAVAVTEQATGTTYVVFPERALCTCDEPGPNLTCSHATYIVTQSGEMGDRETDVADRVLRALSRIHDSLGDDIDRLSTEMHDFELQQQAVTQLKIALRGEGPDPTDRYNIPDPDEM